MKNNKHLNRKISKETKLILYKIRIPEKKKMNKHNEAE